MSKRIKPGDIFEIPTSRGFAYAQFILRHPQWGAMIRVLPSFFKTRPAFDGIVSQEERFITFFPLHAAVSRGIFEIVENMPLPEKFGKFPLFRGAGFIDRSGQVHDWWLWDGVKEWDVGKLTPELRKLPICAVWNDTMLIQRIEEEWTPETDSRSIIP